MSKICLFTSSVGSSGPNRYYCMKTYGCIDTAMALLCTTLFLLHTCLPVLKATVIWSTGKNQILISKIPAVPYWDPLSVSLSYPYRYISNIAFHRYQRQSDGAPGCFCSLLEMASMPRSKRRCAIEATPDCHYGYLSYHPRELTAAIKPPGPLLTKLHLH